MSVYETKMSHKNSNVMVLDLMLATGSSSTAAIRIIKEHGAKSITLFCIVGAPGGIDRIMKDHPDVHIYLAGLDKGLN